MASNEPSMVLEDFNLNMRQMMTDGFRTGFEATFMKYPGAPGENGPQVLSLAVNEQSGVGGMAQLNLPMWPRPARAPAATVEPASGADASGADAGSVAPDSVNAAALQATFTPDLMCYTKLTFSPEASVAGLKVEVDSAVGAGGVMPLMGLDVKSFRPLCTIHANASPMNGLMASLTANLGGRAPAHLGAQGGLAAMFEPSGFFNSYIFGLALGGGALAAQFQGPRFGSGRSAELQLSATAPVGDRGVLSVVAEKVLPGFGSGGAQAGSGGGGGGTLNGCVCAGYRFPVWLGDMPIPVFAKALCIAGPVADDGGDFTGHFATAKGSLQAHFPGGQLSVSTEVPIAKASPGEAVRYGLGLSLGM